MNSLTKISSILCTIFLLSCSQLRPESVQISNYPDLAGVFSSELKKPTSIIKRVWLDGTEEIKTLTGDSLDWEQEIAFMKEINPNQPSYAGAFLENVESSKTELVLKGEENGALKKLTYSKSNDQIEYITASILEDKDVFVHQREISIDFVRGEIQNYKIKGFQKILLKDTIKFEIEVSITP